MPTLLLAACSAPATNNAAHPKGPIVTLSTPDQPTPAATVEAAGQSAAAAAAQGSAAASPPAGPGAAASSAPPTPAPATRSAASQASPSPPAVPPPGARQPGRMVVFNFDDADIEIVLQATSELVVFNYVLAPEVRSKKVTVQTTGRISVDEIFPLLLTILDVNGLAAIKSGDVYRIIPKQGAPQTSTRTVVGAEIDSRIPGDEVLTVIIPLKYVNAVDVVALLRPFVPQQGAITGHRDTNLLVVTDVADNLRRLLDIVKLVDVDITTNELRIITLRHADAQEVAQILTQLFASGRIRTPGTLLAPGTGAPAPAAPAPVLPRPTTGPAGAVDQNAADRPLIVPEPRSNSLIIYARKPEMETIARLIEKLDADIYGGQRVYFYFCENTKARDLAATLDAIFAGGSATSQSSASTQRPTTGTASPGLPSQTTIQTTSARPAVSGALAGLLGELAPGAAETRFIPDEVTNSVVVTTYPRLWTEIEPIVKKLDRMARQVLIEVLAAEVTLDESTSLGIEWAVQHGRFSANFNGAGSVPGVSSNVPIPGGSSTVSTGLNFFTFATNEFLTAINVLSSEDKVNVLSSPSVMTTENKKAVINVSTSVPILTSQQVPIGGTTTTGTTTSTGIVGTQTVEYQDVGIVLTVTPRIGEQGTVALDVKQEVNDILQQQTPPTGSPSFSKREAETSVVLLNNQTLVLGGLIQARHETIKTGIPFLNRIPVLGYLFGNTTENVTKTELVLLITPRVVGTAVEAARITDQMRRITPDIKDSIRNKEFPYPSFEYLKP